VFFYDVLYLESNNNYVTVHTKEKKHIVRNSLQQYMEHFDSTTFFRVHRSFVVNLHHVTIINTDTIKIGEHSIPLSRTFREDLLSKIKLG
jgi:DNA-binding LytR/AlgR family response regulator